MYRNCFWHSEQFLYTTCSPHVLQKEELLTKIYLYYGLSNGTTLPLITLAWVVQEGCFIRNVLDTLIEQQSIFPYNEWTNHYDQTSAVCCILDYDKALITQPMLQCRPNRTELRSMDYFTQILCNFFFQIFSFGPPR